MIQRYINIIILLLILSINGFSQTHTYYFDATSGNDSYNSTQAQSQATPWKTLNKLNQFATSLVPGDHVSFKCGETFYGKIVLGKSGTAAQPIVFSSYGSGAKPIITGFSSVTSWTNIGTNLWESTSAVKSSTTMLMMVNKGSSLLPISRLPKVTDANNGYITLTSHTGSGVGAVLTSSSLSSIPSMVGGEVVIRKNHWIIDRYANTAQTSSTVTLGTWVPDENGNSDAYAITDGWGFFLQNSINACTQQDDWYYNTSTRKVGMYSVGSPSGINIAAIDTLVTISNRSYIKFVNLSFTGANQILVYLDLAHDITFSNCTINYSGYNGVHLTGSSNQRIALKNSNLSYINNNGWEGNGSTYDTIDNCTIHDIAINAGMGGTSDEKYFGIHRIGNSSSFTNNVMDSIGYTALHFRGTNITVTNNYIHDYCFVKDDGAGIYTYATDNLGTVISNNVVGRGIGASAGTDGSTYAEGIYMDDQTANVTISGNTVFDVSHSGIYIHNAHEITIRDNTVYNAGYRQLDFTHDDLAPSDPIRNVSLKKNIFFAKQSSQYAWRFQTNAADALSFGTADSNYYCRPIDETVDVLRIDGVDYTLATWQSYSSQDAHSKKSPKTVTDTSQILFYYNATNAATTTSLGASYIDVYSNPYIGSITLQPFTSSVLIFQSNVVPLTVNAVNNAINCNGDSTNLTLTGVGGVPPYTYSLDGSTWKVSNIFRVIAGSYTVYAKDAASTIANNSYNVTQPTTITVTVDYGLAPTTVTSHASGGSGYFTYKLDAGSYQSSNIFTNVAAGNHTITAKDSNNCTGTLNFSVISGGTPLTISNIVQDSTALCYGGTTSATVTATGGTAPYTYLWSNSQTTQTATDLTAATYTVTVTDAASHVADTSITITQPTIVSIIQITADSLIASNGGTTQLHYSATGGTGSLQYKLDGGSYSSADSTGGVSAGNHTLYVKDANGCVVSQVFTLTQPPPAVPASINSFRTKRRRYFNG